MTSLSLSTGFRLTGGKTSGFPTNMAKHCNLLVGTKGLEANVKIWSKSAWKRQLINKFQLRFAKLACRENDKLVLQLTVLPLVWSCAGWWNPTSHWSEREHWGPWLLQQSVDYELARTAFRYWLMTSWQLDNQIWSTKSNRKGLLGATNIQAYLTRSDKSDKRHWKDKAMTFEIADPQP